MIDRKKELEKEKEKRLTGNGYESNNEGLYDYQIEQIMKPYHVKGFKGVFAADEMKI